MAALPPNPLPPCPTTPNCVRESRVYPHPPDAFFAQAVRALDTLRPIASTIDFDARTIGAVFRVFVFKDDVQLLIEPHEEGSTLHIRSASRMGYSDLGVNHRRIKRFFSNLADSL